MINQGNNVPDKTIAVVMDDLETNFSYDQIDTIISKPSKKREWFTPHFYRCLPLTIGNQYGFIIKSQFDFSVVWNGGLEREDTNLIFHGPLEEVNTKFPLIQSHFGSGIITINPPFTLRTPPGVNLMTINPPNFILPNITVMTGVVESDNLRRNFTINLKIQTPNVITRFNAGTPLACVLPIPRYFSDEFELKNADDVLDYDLVTEEIQAMADGSIKRQEIEEYMPYGVGRDYLLGKDVYGNEFPDHQKP